MLKKSISEQKELENEVESLKEQLKMEEKLVCLYIHTIITLLGSKGVAME